MQGQALHCFFYILDLVLASLCESVVILLVESLKVAAVKSLADLLCKLVVEIEVVLNCKTHTNGLLRLDKMADIGAAMVAAGGTAAVLVDGTGIAGILLVHNVHLAVPRENVSVACVTGGHYAVEEVNSEMNCLKNILGVPTPIRYLGLFSGIKGSTALMMRYISSASSPTASPPMA